MLPTHLWMLAKGDVFYGVAVKPPKGKEEEVWARLEQILKAHGYAPRMTTIECHIVFEDEYSAQVMEEVKQYLASIEDYTPSPPVMKRGNYFQMLAYKWLDGTGIKRYKFNRKSSIEIGNEPQKCFFSDRFIKQR